MVQIGSAKNQKNQSFLFFAVEKSFRKPTPARRERLNAIWQTYVCREVTGCVKYDSCDVL